MTDLKDGSQLDGWVAPSMAVMGGVGQMPKRDCVEGKAQMMEAEHLPCDRKILRSITTPNSLTLAIASGI